MLLARNIFRKLGDSSSRYASKLAFDGNAITSTSERVSPLLRSLTKKEKTDGILKLKWNNGETTTFSSILLRDSCRCPNCYDDTAKQRMLDTVKNVPLNILPTHTRICDDQVSVRWPDGHKSSYSHQFLWAQNNDETGHNDEDSDISSIEPRLWDKSYIEENMPFFDFNAVLNDDSLRYDWFRQFVTWGFTILQGAASNTGEIYRLREMFGGYFKNTHYGETFHIVTKHNPNSLAYKPDAILPHMDLPHMEYSPGIQALHCIEQSAGTGGASTLVDGFHASEQLKEMDRSSFDILSNQKVSFRDCGTDVHGDYETFFERPIIGVKDGKVNNMGYSNWLRDYQMKGDAEKIHRFFESYYKFTHLITDPRNMLSFRLKEGDVLIFNNHRLLHGRTAFSNTEKMQRNIHSCYFDWDGLLGYMRRVKRTLDGQQQI